MRRRSRITREEDAKEARLCRVDFTIKKKNPSGGTK